ncbi:ABC transporter permease subunit [Actinomadura rifamycini]|uniref:ABC transporter permease subunit n=1 Tax=Actinomadura rifamycini TaxID=31962 RepID=UPI00041BA0BB|nr:ABC transporter permease subunit [Actinomadura rifamycini]
MTAAPYRSTVRAAGDGFGRLLLAEWTKLRSVPRWLLALGASIVLTVLVALLSAAGTQSTGGGGAAPDLPPAVTDQGHYTYRTLTGDGSITARVASQRAGRAWAKAGLMVRAGTGGGAPYAAVMVTPGHGVRLQTGYEAGGEGGGNGAAPHWLKLERSGTSVTGYASEDGRAWRRVGGVRLDGLPETVAAGLFVASPDAVEVVRRFGGEEISGRPTDTTATFDGVALGGAWRDGTAGGAADAWRDRAGPGGPAAPEGTGSTRAGGVFTLTGSGDIGPDLFSDDTTRTALTGVLVGQAAVVAAAVLFVTAEYRRGMIAVTLAASPRRGRVLAAKAAVMAAAGFAAGLAAAAGALAVTGLGGRDAPSLVDGAVLRAVLGTALLLAVVAVLSVAVAVVVRRSAPAITLVLLALLVPQIAATGLPVSAARWLERLTPAAGFAVQQTVPRYDTAIGPWAGLGVLCAYTAVAVAAAAWLLRRRDA